MAIAPIGSPRRIVALLVVSLMIIIPALWIAWSLSAALAVAESITDQSETLASLQSRLSALAAGSKGAQANSASVYLPGKTPAIAGAALQRIVANTIEGAGGRLAESEISRSESAEEEPGVVKLRVSFDTDIVNLQRIIFGLETGAPILMLQAVTVEAAETAGASEGESPGLSVVLLVQGYWET